MNWFTAGLDKVRYKKSPGARFNEDMSIQMSKSVGKIVKLALTARDIGENFM